MNWTTILKGKPLRDMDAVKAIARDFGGYANQFDYNYTYEIFDLSTDELKQEMQFFLSDFEKHYEKGRIEEAEKKQIQSPVEEFLRQLDNTMRVKDWDEGR